MTKMTYFRTLKGKLQMCQDVDSMCAELMSESIQCLCKCEREKLCIRMWIVCVLSL